MSLSESESSALVSAHAKWLSAFLRGLTQSEADAEDAFQEVWVRVFSGANRRIDVSERAYLARVARSVVVDRFRRNGRYVLSLDATPGEEGAAEALVDVAPTPCEQAERVSAHEAVVAAVRSLRRGPREVVLLRLEGELTFQEIADELEVPLGTVLTWMRVATEALKRKLKECYGRGS